MSRKVIRWLAVGLAVLIAVAAVVFLYERHERAEMIEANMRWSDDCGAYGTITHRPTGRTLTIDKDADLALFEMDVLAGFQPAPSVPVLTMYTLKVFAFNDQGEHEGDGFELHFTGQEGGRWNVSGGFYNSYDPNGDGLSGSIGITGASSGLDFDGSGGRTEASLRSAYGGLAADFDLELTVACK